MTTALKIIKGGYRKATINAGYKPLSDSETADALEILNNWLIQQNALGALTGIDPVVSLDTDLFEPRWATRTIMLMIGGEICEEFGKPVSPEHAGLASSAYNAMLTLSQPAQGVDYPDTLPIGSGNTDEYGDNESLFFPSISENNF